MKINLQQRNFRSLNLLILTIFMLISLNSNSQSNTKMETGTFNDFTLTAFGSGDTINLYSYLDSYKVVILDFFEYECGPCYQYHQLHVLNNFYNIHGPNGDNTAMVIQMCTFSDADSSKLTGNNGGNWDWLAGIDYPTIVIPDDEFYNVFGMHNWGTPAIVKICPDKIFTRTYPMNSSMTAPSPEYTLDGLTSWMNSSCGIYAGVQDLEEQLSINCYPNPASTILHIDGLINSKSEIRIFNILGEELIRTSNQNIDVSELPEGIYSVIIDNHNAIINKKILIAH